MALGLILLSNAIPYSPGQWNKGGALSVTAGLLLGVVIGASSPFLHSLFLHLNKIP